MMFLFCLALYGLYLWRIGYYRAKKLELEGLVRDRTADLAQSMESLKSTQDKLVLSEKQASLGRLVSGVAHEINTPLGIARMAYSTAESSALELFEAFGINKIQDKPVLSRYKKYVASNGLVESSLGRLSNLVNSFKQISVNEDDWKFTVFEVEVLLRNMLNVHRDQAEAKSVHINLEVALGLEIYSCREIIKNVASELVNNALVHGFAATETGVVTVRAYLAKTDEGVVENFVLQVEDDGAGVADELLQTVFDPFTAAKTSNLGLGLHVVVNSVSSVLRGDIVCNTNLDQGSCFTVTVPLLEPEVSKPSPVDVFI